VFNLTFFMYVTLLKILINEKGVDPIDFSLIRTLVQLGLALVYACATKQEFAIAEEHRKPFLYRSICGTVAMLSTTFVAAMIPMLIQVTIFNTAPFWASLIGYQVLGERILPFEKVCMAASFGAVLLLGLNGLLAGEDPEQTTDKHAFGESRLGSYTLGCALALLVALGYATVGVMIRMT
jgi:drug/metabolite transporter (DMT)-like permease